MKSFSIRVILAVLVSGALLIEASPHPAVPPIGKRDGLQGRARGTGTSTTATAAAAAVAVKAAKTSTTAAAQVAAAAGKTTPAAGKTTTTAGKAKTTTAAAAAAAASLNATVVDCQVIAPANLLTAAGLATPWQLKAPCSMAVATQQAFAEAAVFDPATNTVSVYHPLIINAGTQPAAAPVVPTIPAGATVALWFGFNGAVLKLVDANGLDANNSPQLKGANCINGLQGVQNDVFGQVSWCNAQQFFAAAQAGNIAIPALGVDSNGATCPTSRSFEITDACPSDNVPTQYLLLANGQTAQDTAANRAANPAATVINNASDEGLLANIVDPLIGCTPFLGPSLDNPGAMVPALALSELQASALQAAPIGLVPLNDPDTLLTANTQVSVQKTNQYRLGVGQPVVNAANTTTSGALIPYCNNMLAVAPTFLKNNQAKFIGQTTPAANVGNNLFTFLCERFIMSLTQLNCPMKGVTNPVVCKVNGNAVATSCTVNVVAGATSIAATAATTAPTTKPTKMAGMGK